MMRMFLPVLLLLLPMAVQARDLSGLADKSTLAGALSRELRSCWVMPEDAPKARIVVDLLLAPDGYVVGQPDFGAQSAKDRDRHAALIGSIVRATRRCAPFASIAGAGLTGNLAVQLTFVVP